MGIYHTLYVAIEIPKDRYSKNRLIEIFGENLILNWNSEDYNYLKILMEDDYMLPTYHYKRKHEEEIRKIYQDISSFLKAEFPLKSLSSVWGTYGDMSVTYRMKPITLEELFVDNLQTYLKFERRVSEDGFVNCYEGCNLEELKLKIENFNT